VRNLSDAGLAGCEAHGRTCLAPALAAKRASRLSGELVFSGESNGTPGPRVAVAVRGEPRPAERDGNGQPTDPYIATMAPTSDTQRLRLRAVFAERETSRAGVDLKDLESAFTQLDALFKVAWAISDPETLRLEAEFSSRFPHGSGGEALVLHRLPPSVPAPLPVLRSLAMTSPVDLVAEIPEEFLRGGGAVAALDVLVGRALNFPLRIQAHREKLRAEMAAWEAARTKSELLVIARQADALKALEAPNLEIRSAELLDSDTDQDHRESEK
jgi:hypothetical protein